MFVNKIFSVGFLVFIFLICLLPGCEKDKPTRSLFIEYNLSGTWEEKYSMTFGSMIGTPENMNGSSYTKDLISTLYFANDSFSIIITNDNGDTEQQYFGRYGILSDTLTFFIRNEAGEIEAHSINFRFVSNDSLNLWTIVYPTEDPNIMSIPLFTDIVWNVCKSFDCKLMTIGQKHWGYFTRQ
jgi:hypothetical protein